MNFGSEIVLTTFALQLLSGIIASVLTFDNFKAHFNNPKPSLTGAVVSTFNGGCFFGAMLGGWFVLFPDADRTIHTRSHRLADKLGRKRTIQVNSLVYRFTVHCVENGHRLERLLDSGVAPCSQVLTTLPHSSSVVL